MTSINSAVTSPTLTRRGSLAIAAGAFFAGSARAAVSFESGSVDAAARKVVGDHASPAVSISIMRRGALVYSRAFGMANLETSTPATPRSIFKIGSITKQFTAAALLLLQQDAKLSIDDPLSRFYPDFPRASQTTLRQMLSHTSGIGNYTNSHPPEAFLQDARRDYDNEALYAWMRRTDPLFLFEPGTDWAYSNTAYVLLGLIVEKAAGEPYGAFFKRRLFAPAGMVDTAVDDAADVVPGRASGYSPHKGSDTAFDNARFIAMTTPGGAGSIRSTSVDLCRWHDALFSGRVLSAASLAAMTTPVRLKNGAVPEVALRPGEPKKPVNYGLGLFVDTENGHTWIGHGGGIFGFRSDLRTFVKEGVTIAILMNIDAERGAAHADVDGLNAAAAKAALASA